MKNIIISLVFAASVQFVSAQVNPVRDGKETIPPGTKQKPKYLTIIERDRDKPNTLHVDSVISDINSSLELAIDKDALLKRLTTSGAYKVPPETDKLLAILKKALEAQKLMLDAVRVQLASYNPMDTTRSAAFNKTMAGFANAALDLFIQDPVTQNYYIQQDSDPFDGVLYAFDRRIRELGDAILTQNQHAAQTLQLGAWIQTKRERTPLHLDGFDNNPSPGFYEVNRWRIIPGPEELAKYEEMKKLAKENRDNGLDYLNQSLKININVFITSFNKILEDFRKDIDKEYQEIRNIISNQGIDTVVKKISDGYKDLVETIQPLIDKYRQLVISENTSAQLMLSDFLSDASLSIGKVTAVGAEMKMLVGKLKSLPSATQPQVRTFIKAQEDKLKRLEIKVDDQGLRQLRASVKLDETALEFTDKVLSHSLKDIPETATLDLRDAGPREAGDQIIFQLRIFDTATRKGYPLETRSITMYEVLPHIYGLASVVFANPWGASQVTNNFQMQPAYNFLVKGVWPWTPKYYRKSAIRNTLTDFSYGLHIGAPDFDKDDVPEIGVGLVVSALHDYVQLGIANNLFKGNWYWFFGIRLPVPTLSLSGSAASSPAKLQ